jgi:hypothetical protein
MDTMLLVKRRDGFGVHDPKRALDVAMRLMALAAPNGRDYYPQGPDALPQAGVEHRERIAKVKEVYDELGSLASAIHDQGREL